MCFANADNLVGETDMATLSVVLKSTEVKESLLQAYRPDNWSAFETAVENYLKQQMAGVHISSVTADIAQSAHPGPLLLKFTVNSQLNVDTATLKQELRR
jgi:hypothetical protein